MVERKERNFIICISVTIMIVIALIISGAAGTDHKSNLDHKSADNSEYGNNQGNDEYGHDEYGSDDHNHGNNDGQDITTE